MKLNKMKVDGYDVIFSSEWTKKLETLTHWVYYWTQASLVRSNTEIKDRIIEIGVGSGFLCNYLKSKNYTIHSVDIDESKHPDYVSNALEFDYGKVNARIVVAFEIFEHIPYPTFKKTIARIAESSVDKILFSIPKCQRSIVSFTLKIPKLKKIALNISIPKNKIMTESHFWELGRGEMRRVNDEKFLVPEKDIINLFNEKSFKVKRVKKVNSIQFYIATRVSS